MKDKIVNLPWRAIFSVIAAISLGFASFIRGSFDIVWKFGLLICIAVAVAVFAMQVMFTDGCRQHISMVLMVSEDTYYTDLRDVAVENMRVACGYPETEE